MNDEYNEYTPESADNDISYHYSYSRTPETKKKGIGAGTIVAVALACSLLGGIVGAGGVYFLGNRAAGPEKVNSSTVYEGEREQVVIDTASVNTGKELSAAQVYANNVNSTVGITTSVTTNIWGFQTTGAASGSGFILTSDGYIVTNYHVIEDSTSIRVSLYDGTEYDATIIGYDANNDIAVLKIEAEGLTPVVLGDSSNINVGDSVVAIGNPLGELTFTLTGGYVSALDREVTLSSGVTMDLMQTDCAINSGNSGGALFNMYGEVIGVTNAKYSSNTGTGASVDNIGFAIPINSVRGIIESLIENGYIVKPYLGISVSNVSSESMSYGLPQGAAVRAVESDGPADKGGLKENDIITAANGNAITGSNDLTSFISSCQAGDVVTFTVYRQGNVIDVTVTIGEKVQSGFDATTQTTQQQSGGYIYPWGGFGGW